MRRGFTLIELVIAVAIVFVLVAVISSVYYVASQKTMKNAVASNAFNAIVSYYNNNGALPSDLNGFVNGSSAESQGYIKSSPFVVSASATPVSGGYNITIIVDGKNYQFFLKALEVSP
ncbi:MAG: type II secretion system protein [Conexivisphaerales archaeon]